LVQDVCSVFDAEVLVQGGSRGEDITRERWNNEIVRESTWLVLFAEKGEDREKFPGNFLMEEAVWLRDREREKEALGRPWSKIMGITSSLSAKGQRNE
jgi:hypothetical protein